MPKNHKLTALIIDDERLARKELVTLLKEIPMIEIVGEADSAGSALTLIDQTDPDLLFLDIQMPGESGFDLLAKINTRARTIFVTAYDEYAIRAFEVNALDYLLKPVNPERLKTTIDRIRETPEPVGARRTKLEGTDTLFILFGAHFRLIRINTIVCITASGDYSELFLSDGSHGLTSKTMAEWEERLPEKMFARIHRSAIINLGYVDKMEEWFNGTYRIAMSGIPEPLNMSRRYAKLIREKLG